MAEFKKYKLGDIADIRTSNVDKKITLNQKTVKLCNFVDVYYNWAITKSNYDSFMTATASDEEISKFSLKKGQVAFTKDSETRDDIGIPAYIAEDFKDVVLGYHTALATPDENIVTGEYLNAFMHSSYIQKYFELNATGSGMRYTLSQQTLHDIPILAPDLDAQHKIGSLLSKIDRKISINREINRNLEELAKQIYDYWFVQFDFPNEEGKPYKSSGGKMIWNETLKREIPESWESGKIGDLFESQAGFAFKSSEWSHFGYPVLTIKNIQNDGSVSFNDTTFIKNYNDKLEKYTVNNGNMIFAMSGNTIGKIGIIATNEKNVLINQRVLILRTTTSTIAFPYFIVSNQNVQNLVFQLGANSVQPNISEDKFKNIGICIPNRKILQLFNVKLTSVFEKIISNRISIQELTTLRDSLLPLLMNGQVTLNSCLSAD